MIVFSPSSSDPLSQVPASGGTPAPVTKLDPSKLEHSHRWPSFLPDGRHFLYLCRASSTDIIYAASLDGKENKELLRKHSNVVFGNGCLLFIEEGALIAQPFDPGGLELKGLPATVAEGVLYDPGYGRGEFSISGHGELLYAPGGAENAGLAWFDRSGNFNGFIARSVKNMDARISPDGSKVAYSNDSEEGSARRLTTDLWIYDRNRGVPSRLTFDPGDEIDPVWSPDGKQIAFASNRSGKANLYRINADATAGEENLAGSDFSLAWGQATLPARFALAPAGPSVEKAVQPHHFLEAVGRRGAILGTEDGTFEAWLNPIKVASHFRLSVYFDGALEPVDLAPLAERVAVSPGRATITHSHAAFTIRQTWVGPWTSPSCWSCWISTPTARCACAPPSPRR